MRLISSVALAATAALAVSASSAAAEPAARVRVFANCTAMHKVWKGGVERPGAHDKRRHGGHARYKPYVNAADYRAAAARGQDRDHDGIACEQ